MIRLNIASGQVLQPMTEFSNRPFKPIVSRFVKVGDNWMFPTLRPYEGIACYCYNRPLGNGAWDDATLTSAPSITYDVERNQYGNWVTSFSSSGTQNAQAFTYNSNSSAFYTAMIPEIVGKNKVKGDVYGQSDPYIHIRDIKCWACDEGYGRTFAHDNSTISCIVVDKAHPTNIYVGVWACLLCDYDLEYNFLDGAINVWTSSTQYDSDNDRIMFWNDDYWSGNYPSHHPIFKIDDKKNGGVQSVKYDYFYGTTSYISERSPTTYSGVKSRRVKVLSYLRGIAIPTGKCGIITPPCILVKRPKSIDYDSNRSVIVSQFGITLSSQPIYT